MPKKKNTSLSKPVADDIKKVAQQIREVNFWQCVTFADTIGRYCEITMKKDDISPLHAIAMYYLIRAGGSSTPTHLAELMFRSKHSVTKIVDNLEKEGFIEIIHNLGHAVLGAEHQFRQMCRCRASPGAYEVIH